MAASPHPDGSDRSDRSLWRGLFRRHPGATPSRQKGAKRHYLIALFVGLVSLAAVIIGSAFGNVHGPALHAKIVAWAAAGVFVIAGMIATRRIAAGLGVFVAIQTIPSAGSAVRFLTSAAGYLIILFATFGLLDVSIGHLLVGGAITGVVLGIAAEQSLGNVFAGLVLLFARPFSVGDHIRIRSGALGGIFDGVVLGVSLTYVTVQSEGGPLKIPNSSMLAAAVGPYVPKVLSPEDETT